MINNISSIVIQKEREKRKAYIAARMLDNPKFKRKIEDLKNYIAIGFTIEEARWRMGIKQSRQWHFLVQCMAELTLEPEKIFLEYTIKAKGRYAQIFDLMRRAKDAGDRITESKMMLALMKLDDSYIQAANVLGLLKTTPEQLPDGGEGLSDEDVRKELDEVRAIVARQLQVDDRPSEPILIEVQSNPQSREQKNNVG